MKRSFPDGFSWGVATTAEQIEGGIEGTGRGRSMWPAFAAEPGRIRHGDSPEGSARSVEFPERDLDALARLNLTSYNFSASWPRLLPDGAGRVDERGADYYDRLIDGLLERGIEPDLSLYDWDLPIGYAETGGWERRELAERFGDYVDLLIRRYGDRVKRWMTFNEISTQATNGYRSGNHAPGRSSVQGCLRAYHHLMLGHGQSVHRIREAVDGATISVVDNLLQYYPATVTDADREATDRQWRINSWYLLDALFHGRIDDAFRHHHEKVLGADFDHVEDGDLETIGAPFDEFGVNYFTSFSVADDPEDPGRAEKISPAPGPQSPFGWTLDPHGMLLALRELRDRYTGDMPIFVGECGIGQIDTPGPDGRVKDPERIDYLEAHLGKVLDAIDEGIPVTGFYVWSLMDNYEWDDGYEKRFGLYYTRYENPATYLIKDSGEWYARVCTGNALPERDGGG